jgi:hypothetical protein
MSWYLGGKKEVHIQENLSSRYGISFSFFFTQHLVSVYNITLLLVNLPSVTVVRAERGPI